MPSLYSQPLAIVDVETIGMSYKNGGVIDIGILRIEDGHVVQTMRQLINPGSVLPEFITQLTGISNDDVADAPIFADVAQDVYDLLDGCIFVAHNARFDYSFIKEELLRSGYQFRPRLLCTVRLSRALYPQYRSHKLDALIERFSIPMFERHRAFADAEATWKALQIMVDQHEDEIINKQVSQQLRQPSLPVNIAPETIKNLPETPGVYIFKSNSGAPLYVGKSINIRDRVLSHFSDDHRSPKEQRIAQEVSDIETITATGELGALLTESQLVKQLMPIHNRMLRRQTELVLALQGITNDGYPTIKIERHAEIATSGQRPEYGMRDTFARHSGAEQSEEIESQRSYRLWLQDDSQNSSNAIPYGHAIARQDEQLKTKNYNLKSQSQVAIEAVMGVYKSERQAKESLLALAKEFQLCHKLLGLQKTAGACFSHQLKICRGACVGKESSLEYLLRFNQAFSTSRIKQWSYPSPILITEVDHQGNSDGYIINNWCLVSHVMQRDQVVEHQAVAPNFDLDQYKILKRFIENPKNQKLISLASLKQLDFLHMKNAPEVFTSEAS